VDAALKALRGPGRFLKFADNETKIFRFTPMLPGAVSPFYKTVNQHKFKDQDGRQIALSNLAEHGTTETGRSDYIADLAAVLAESNDKEEIRVGLLITDQTNQKFYAQGYEKQPDGTWFGPAFLSLPFTGATDVLTTFRELETLGEPDALDVEQGQAIMVSSITPAGAPSIQRKYRSSRTGQKMPLSAIDPSWESRQFKDVYEALQLKVYTRDMQKAIAKITYPGLDWDRLEAEYNL
jgi:hypothetical protein